MNNHKYSMRLADLFNNFTTNLITLGELSDGVDTILNEVRTDERNQVAAQRLA